MSDISQRISARLKSRIDKKAWEPDEPYPTRQQELSELEELGCLGPDGTGCPYDNISSDQDTRLCEECDASIEAASLEKYVPWNELEECCPDVYADIDKEFEELKKKARGVVASWDVLNDFPQIVDAAEKLREVLLYYVEQAKEQT